MKKVLLSIAASIFTVSFVANAAAPVWEDEQLNNSSSNAQNVDYLFNLDFNALIGDENFINTSQTYPHVEIIGSAENPLPWAQSPPDAAAAGNSEDWYSFTIENAGSIGIFDIDCAWQNEAPNGFTGEPECADTGLMYQFDAFVQLFDTDGTTRLTDTTGGDDDGNAVFGLYDVPQDPGSNGDVVFRPGLGERAEASRDSFVVYTFDEPGVYFVRVGSFGGYVGDEATQQPPLGDYLLHVTIISDSCTASPTSAGLDISGCTDEQILAIVGESIEMLIPTASKKVAHELEKAAKNLRKAQYLIAEGKVKHGLKKLRGAVKALAKAQKRGADIDAHIYALVDYARAKAEAAIAASSSPKDIRKARKEMAKAEKELFKGKPGKAVHHFAKAWEKVSKK